MAYVAAGRFTGFWELDLSSWDIAAGALLVEEAGGSVSLPGFVVGRKLHTVYLQVSDMRGKPYTLLVRDILATNGVSSIHQGLIDAITRADALYVDPER
jgi:myo-inositol-1(or 4)-monophosphatase